MNVIYLQLISAILVSVLDDIFDQANNELQQLDPLIRSQLIAKILNMYNHISKDRDEAVFGCFDRSSS